MSETYTPSPDHPEVPEDRTYFEELDLVLDHTGEIEHMHRRLTQL